MIRQTTKLRGLLALGLALGLVSGAAWAMGTPAGTVITNTATVDYKDANGNAYPQLSSAPVTFTVEQVAGVDITPPTGSQTGQAGTTANFATVVTNTGNGNDTLDLALTGLPAGYTATIYADLNGDGVLQQSEIDAGAITSTGQLPADGPFPVIIVVTIPGTAADGDTASFTLTATSQFDGTVSDTYNGTVTVSQGVIVMNKTADNTTPKPGETVTYTITYENTGSAPADAVVITDPLNVNLTYVAGSTKLNGSAVSPDPYDSGTRTITVGIGTVAAGASGTITFQATVNAGVPAGTAISNVATATYQVGGQTRTSDSTLATITVAILAGVDIEATQAAFANPGDVVQYEFTVTNTGNATDLFNGTAPSTAGFAYEFWVDVNGNGIIDDGDHLAADNDADGRPDTGYLASGETLYFIMKVTVPVGTPDGTVDVGTLTAISKNDPTVTDFITVTTTVTAPVIAIAKSVSPTTDIKPGDTVTYTITVTNSGTGTATDVVVADTVPTNTTYVPGSIKVNGVAKTDAVDGDNAHFAGNNVVATVNALGPGGTLTVEFRATVN